MIAGFFLGANKVCYQKTAMEFTLVIFMANHMQMELGHGHSVQGRSVSHELSEKGLTDSITQTLHRGILRTTFYGIPDVIPCSEIHGSIVQSLSSQ
jgi:hypothetical protein